MLRDIFGMEAIACSSNDFCVEIGIGAAKIETFGNAGHSLKFESFTLTSPIGAGPAGLTLARLLQMRGVDVVVYERDESMSARVSGSSLDIPNGGRKAIRAAGLDSAFLFLFWCHYGLN